MTRSVTIDEIYLGGACGQTSSEKTACPAPLLRIRRTVNPHNSPLLSASSTFFWLSVIYSARDS